MKVVVIGAGLSGLTSAAFMAKAGHDVAVYEQNGFIGGVASLISKNGYSWEQGPLLLGDMLPGESVYQLLKRLGITLQVWQEERGIVLPDYDMWHPDDYQGPYWRKERLKSLFPDESEGIDAYYDFYDNMTALMRIALEKPSIA
ncbi:MAG TPA: FAD-dependent oxidoreductase, partial [Candidatus Izemoplasmatales bacterium]|nr:FAD-dependent oxidoreductase [Candidatus Izemoplasmatales bacterium]